MRLLFALLESDSVAARGLPWRHRHPDKFTATYCFLYGAIPNYAILDKTTIYYNMLREPNNLFKGSGAFLPFEHGLCGKP